jgi:uncharacterized protein YdaU (DUF1376 family)
VTKRRSNPYHRRFHGDALGGYELLTLEERGAYTTLLDQMYDHGGPIRDDVRNACAWLNCDVRVWKRLRAALVEKHQKFHAYTDADGRDWLVNNRVQTELKLPTYAELTANLSPKFTIANAELSAKSDEKPKENKHRGQSKKPEIAPSIPLPIPYTPIVPSGDADLEAAMAAWNETASACGLPIAKGLPAGRRKHLRKRLNEHGVEGWVAALNAVSKSRFCRGLLPGRDGGRPFRADIDFILQPSKFQRLIEGFYGDDAPAPAATGPAPPIDERDRWRGAVRQYGADLWWNDELGPRPGRPGCAVPIEILAEFGFVEGVTPISTAQVAL